MADGKRNLKLIVGGLLGTIVLGAIGSGLWEVALKPFFSFATNSVLNIATLGMESLKDDLYRKVAQDDIAATGVGNLYLTTILAAILLAVMPSIELGRMYARRKVKKIAEMPKGNMAEEEWLAAKSAAAARLAEKMEKSENRGNLHAYTLSASALWLIASAMFNLVKLDYVNSAGVFFHQSLAITRPLMTQEQENDLLSRFARIHSKRDYSVVISELDQLAKSKGMELPKFSIW